MFLYTATWTPKLIDSFWFEWAEIAFAAESFLNGKEIKRFYLRDTKIPQSNQTEISWKHYGLKLKKNTKLFF